MNMLEQMETRPLVRVRVRRKKRRSKKPLILLLALLFVVASVLSVVGHVRYSGDFALAQTGIQHLQKAESLLAASPQSLLDTHVVSQAQTEFSSASQVFTQLNGDLQAIPGVATLVPVYGSRLAAAQNLVPLALALSQSGVAGCDILNALATSLHEPLTPQAHGITLTDLTRIATDLQQISYWFSAASDEVSQLQPAAVQFDPRISKLVTSFSKEAPVIQAWLNDLGQLLPVAPAVLGIGTPANYLVELLDSTELRPGGGFIGNYGIATLSGGRLLSARINDTYLLDKPFVAAGHSITYPPGFSWFNVVAPDSWSLRDSNLEADFPTSARYGEQTYAQEGGNEPLRGVIAITPALIQQALTITGPIAVPEYKEIVTPQNLVDRIHYYQSTGSDLVLSPDNNSSQRKHFTSLLAEHFLARVRQLAPSASGKLFQVLINGLRSKNLQIYFNAPEAEALLRLAHVDAAIQPAAGDDLLVVDTNIGATKDNGILVNTMNDVITLDTSGNAVHHLKLNYAWPAFNQAYASDIYLDYVRVYAPAGSILQGQEGWEYDGSSNNFGHDVLNGYFELPYGQTNTITLTWTVPHAALHTASGWQYQETLQRQAGAQWMVQTQIILPPCASLTNESGGLKAAGKQNVKLSQPLTENTTIGVDYAC